MDTCSLGKGNALRAQPIQGGELCRWLKWKFA